MKIVIEIFDAETNEKKQYPAIIEGKQRIKGTYAIRLYAMGRHIAIWINDLEKMASIELTNRQLRKIKNIRIIG